MYHWYVLIIKKLKSKSLQKKEEEIALICGNDGELTDNTDTRLLWIGFLEIMPIVTGLLATDYLPSFLFPFDYLIIGVIISIAIVFIFKDDVPHQPISFKNIEKSKIVNS